MLGNRAVVHPEEVVEGGRLAAQGPLAHRQDEVPLAQHLVRRLQRSGLRQRKGQLLFTYLHLAPEPTLTAALRTSGCTAIAYETVTDARGGLPLLAPMSEVAGRMKAVPADSDTLQTGRDLGICFGD